MTPRVQGEPIVPGSDFELFASEGAKRLYFNSHFIATGALFIYLCFSIKVLKCSYVSIVLFKFYSDVKVVTKMLNTYDSMSTKSQSAEA